MPNAYLVYNPTAGRVPIQPFIKRARAVLESNGWRINVQASQSAQHVVALARQAASEGMDAFFLAGGDGTINLATEGLAGTRTALGVLPAGTTNVLARDLNLPKPSLVRWDAVEEAAQRLAKAPAYWTDVGVCNGQHFFLWAGVGLDAEVVNEIEPRARWEKPFTFPKYIFATLKNTALWQGMHLQVETDGNEVNGNFVIAVATNIPSYAGGVAEISPNAYLDDGEMDLWLFRAENLAEMAQRVLEVLTRKHLDSDGFIYLPFRQARLSGQRPLMMHMDGEPRGAASQIWLTVKPRAMRLLVPKGGERLFRFPPENIFDVR